MKQLNTVDLDSETELNNDQSKEIAVDVIAPLRKEEKKLLAKHEETIRKNMAGFLAVGAALIAIREKNLYRLQGTFEEYVKAQFGYSRSHAYRLMEECRIAKDLELVNEDLSPIGDICLNDNLLRPLIPLKADQRTEVWQKAKAEAGDIPVTVQHIQQFLPAKPDKARKANKVAAEISTEYSIEALNGLLEQALKAARTLKLDAVVTLLEEVPRQLEKAASKSDVESGKGGSR